jgi:long-chain acyl-CoA synthetase
MEKQTIKKQANVSDSFMPLSKQKPWRKYFKEDTESLVLPEKTIYGSLKATSQTVLDKPALHYYGAEITYREFLAKIDRYADAYTSMGVQAGDVVSFISVALPETVISLYALNKIGAISSFIDPRMDVERIRHFVEKVHSDVLVTLEQVLPKVEPWLADSTLKKVLVQSPADDLPLLKAIGYRSRMPTVSLPKDNRVEWFRDFAKSGKSGCAKEHPYIKDEPCAYTQTGGTTGVPKCVVLTNEGLNAVAMGFQHFGIDAHEGQTFLDIMPIFSSYGIVCGVHMTLSERWKVYLIPDFSPDKFPKLIRKFKPNHLLAVPAFYEKLTHDPKIQKMNLSFVISMGSGGDTITAELEKKLNTFFREHGVRYPIAQGYGMSEVSSAATFGQGFINKPMSVGIPMPMVTIGIFKQDTFEEMPPGEQGEICISGPSVMKEYLDDPAATADLIRIHPDGSRWAHSGDLGYMDEDGFLFVNGRIKQMIIRFDGHKLAPTQIENVILKRDEVNNCVVVPVKDLDHGQGDYPMAVVELKPGFEKKATCQSIFAYCNEIMEERGRPCAVIAMDSIPLTSVGKCDRKAVEQIYRNYNYREVT